MSTAHEPTATIVTAAQQGVLNEHADAIRACARRTVYDIIEIGRHLAEAKKMAGHGNFLSWIEREFAWSEDTAERFIAVHALQRQIPHVAELSLPFSGLYLLAAPSTPRRVVEEVVAKAEAGERMSVVEIKSTIAEARPTKKSKLDPKKTAKPKPVGDVATVVPATTNDAISDEANDTTNSTTEAEKVVVADKPAHKAVASKDIALSEFDGHILRLVQMTRGTGPGRFVKTAVPAADLARLTGLLSRLGRFLKETTAESLRDADASAAAMKAKHAVLDVDAAP